MAIVPYELFGFTSNVCEYLTTSSNDVQPADGLSRECTCGGQSQEITSIECMMIHGFVFPKTDQ